MITKERLEELIEQGATIYSSHIFDSENGIKLSSQHFEASCEGLVFKYKIYVILYCDLWETKEEADWHREFGCIERTERLELPTWEDLKNCLNRFCYFTDCCGREYCLSYIRATNKLRLRYFIDELDEEELGVWELTKENYTLACRKAKELFLGD